MPKINAMMDIGKRSMMNSQTALQTVSHNIANKSTEGYSRQRVEQQTNEAIGEGRLRMGMGAKAVAVTRINNPFLERQIASETNKKGFFDGQSDNLMRVEQIFNEQINKGLNQFVSNFFNSFRELANNPESLASRALVKESAHFLTQDFSRVVGQLNDIQSDIDMQVKATVEEINAMTREVASLNQKVAAVELQGMPANDERDRRDLLIKKLGEKVNIRWAEGDSGMVSITAGDTAVLVSGIDSIDLETARTHAHGSKREGNLDVIHRATKTGSPFTVTNQLRGGTLGGAIEVRDQIINDLREQIDGLAYTLADEVNRVHSLGFNAYQEQGINFFDIPQNESDIAMHLKVNNEILNDTLKIAAAAERDAPGDNRVANVISAIQMNKVMDDGAATLDDFYNSMVGKLAVSVNKSNQEAEHQKNIVSQLNNVRESVSGVSLDEEAVKMIEFQKAFDASARVIKTADEMFDTILNLKR